MKYSILLCAALSVCLLSCDKDSDETAQPTNTELIAKASWKYENAGIDIDKNGTIESPLPSSLIQPCLTDNTLTFTANGSGTLDEGATKCDPTLPQTTQITWSFTNNETTLNLSGGGLLGVSGQVKIIALTEDRLTLSKDTSLPIVGAVALVANLKH